MLWDEIQLLVVKTSHLMCQVEGRWVHVSCTQSMNPDRNPAMVTQTLCSRAANECWILMISSKPKKYPTYAFSTQKTDVRISKHIDIQGETAQILVSVIFMIYQGNNPTLFSAAWTFIVENFIMKIYLNRNLYQHIAYWLASKFNSPVPRLLMLLSQNHCTDNYVILFFTLLYLINTVLWATAKLLNNVSASGIPQNMNLLNRISKYISFPLSSCYQRIVHLQIGYFFSPSYMRLFCAFFAWGT